MTDLRTPPETELIYFGDPMCSWCWGFSPTLDALEKNLGVPMRTVVGGLRPGGEQMTDEMAEFIGHHWEQVAKASGQPFDHTILARRDWKYDTELPCRAVVTMREQQPQDTRRLFDRLHRAFYVEGVNITEPEAYLALVEDLVDDPDAFVTKMLSEEMKTRTWEDFHYSREKGVSGFPTLFVRHGDEIALITRGWAPRDAIEAPIREWIEERTTAMVKGAVCEPGEIC